MDLDAGIITRERCRPCALELTDHRSHCEHHVYRAVDMVRHFSGTRYDVELERPVFRRERVKHQQRRARADGVRHDP